MAHAQPQGFQLPLNEPVSSETRTPVFKLLGQRDQYALNEVLQNQTTAGVVISAMGVITAAITFWGGAGPGLIGMCGTLCLLVAIFGLAMYTGALRMTRIMRNAPEIEAAAVVTGATYTVKRPATGAGTEDKKNE
jgi:hypothetical protein